jgi:hypothetical protein
LILISTRSFYNTLIFYHVFIEMIYPSHARFGERDMEICPRVRRDAKAFVFLAERRFGPLPQALRDRVECADAASIERWLGRLLDATSLETPFGAAN